MYEAQTTETAVPEKVAGVLAEYPSAEAVTEAAEKVRDAGFTKWDVHSPFPIHGIEKDMGITMTKLPWLVLAMALTGLAAGTLAVAAAAWLVSEYLYARYITPIEKARVEEAKKRFVQSALLTAPVMLGTCALIASM